MTHHHQPQTAPGPPSNYHPPTKRTSSFTPRYSQTPTFKRLTHASPRHRSRSSPMHGKSHHGDSTSATRESVKIHHNMAAMDEIAMEEEGHKYLRPHTVDGSRLHSSGSVARVVSSRSSKREAHTRRVWDKGSGTGSPQAYSMLKSSPSARNSRRAKYTTHHIPDPSSRCASSMVSYTIQPPGLISNDMNIYYCYFRISQI